MTGPRLLTKHEVAAMYRVRVSHVERKCRERLVEFTWRGREYGFTEEQARAFARSFSVVKPQTRRAKKTTPPPQEAPVPRPRRTAPTAVGAEIPTANFGVSRLYRERTTS